ncbi:MazG-like family protein [Peptococcus simiae]|uniref:MazG-like family protein n=1 Tax=Peptococcus simiae TaxID=1643805 RepID=A0ABW9GXZ4_9FIRM
MDQKVIALPRLNGLSPNLESTALKLMEETGELAQAIGKYRGLSGERSSYTDKEIQGAIASELLDVAQTAVSMMYVLEEQYDVDIAQALEAHIEKLLRKGYLTMDKGDGQ